MKKIICTNDELFSEDCDLAGYREFLFGLYSDDGEIAGVAVTYDDYGILTNDPEKVLNELDTTGDWKNYDQRPVYVIE